MATEANSETFCPFLGSPSARNVRFVPPRTCSTVSLNGGGGGLVFLVHVLGGDLAWYIRLPTIFVQHVVHPQTKCTSSVSA